MGSEDEVEQSFGRPCVAVGRSKRPSGLTSSIVPRGTPFHRCVDLEFSPIGFDPERFSCGCRGWLPGPPELGAINPYAVHDDGQPARQGHDRLLPSWDSRTSGTIFTAALSSVRTAGPSGHANSSHPSAREGHLSSAEWISSFLLSGLILNGFHAAAVAGSLVHRNSVPSTHMRCMMTASRRARATIAFFIPRRLAICMAQALSQDHFFERNALRCFV